MDQRVVLLKEFYRGLPKDLAKVETEQHGFDFLERLLADGVGLAYGELTLAGLLHKYKLTRIPELRMDEMLQAHVAKACNVCLYFAEGANDLFCFNLDNNSKTDNTAPIPEMELAVRHLGELLGQLGCEPLVIASGRGYHVWCRLTAAVDNERLYDFMLRAGVATVSAVHAAGLDYHRLKLNFYPDQRSREFVSLRLFGSDHAKTKRFSRILTPAGLLEEGPSWDYFESYLRNKTIPVSTFDRAYQTLAQTA